MQRNPPSTRRIPAIRGVPMDAGIEKEEPCDNGGRWWRWVPWPRSSWPPLELPSVVRATTHQRERPSVSPNGSLSKRRADTANPMLPNLPSRIWIANANASRCAMAPATTASKIAMATRLETEIATRPAMAPATTASKTAMAIRFATGNSCGSDSTTVKTAVRLHGSSFVGTGGPCTSPSERSDLAGWHTL